MTGQDQVQCFIIIFHSPSVISMEEQIINFTSWTRPAVNPNIVTVDSRRLCNEMILGCMNNQKDTMNYWQ